MMFFSGQVPPPALGTGTEFQTMKKNPTLLALSVAALFAAPLFVTNLHAQPLVNIQTVTVGDPGNQAATTTYGSVSNVFAIGTYEVTIAQYATFLNTVASVTSSNYLVNLWNAGMETDLNGAGISRSGSGTLASPYSYSVIGTGNRPISYVSWYDAARFANWLNNGATVGASTEMGAYTLNGATSGNSFTRSVGATWFLPSNNEWVKAAYYKGGSTNAGYWLFPTQSDSPPGNVIGSTPNQANIVDDNYRYSVTQSDAYSASQNYLSEVGAYSGSASPYGTYDQGGNVTEWTETLSGLNSRMVRGGYWEDSWGTLRNTYSTSGSPGQETYTIGFRVATVPEPSTYALLVLSAAGLGAHVLRRRWK